MITTEMGGGYCLLLSVLRNHYGDAPLNELTQCKPNTPYTEISKNAGELFPASLSVGVF